MTAAAVPARRSTGDVVAAEVRARRSALAGLVVGALAVLGLPGCSSGDGAGPPPVAAEPRTDAAPRFTIGALPDGHHLAWAGDGTAGQSWGDDTTGTDRPTTVLTRGGSTREADAVLVSATGYQGNQGGLAQNLREYLDLDLDDRFEVDGREALYAETPGDPRPGELIVDRGEDLAVLVQGPADRDLLVAVARATEPTGRATAPLVADPPEDLEVLGHVDADVPPTLRGGVSPVHPAGGGPRGATRVAVLADDGSSLAITGLAGDHADLAALRVVTGGTGTNAAVAGRPAVLLTQTHDGTPTTRTIAFHDRVGNLFVIASSTGYVGGGTVLDEDRLLALARSIRLVDEPTWQAFADAASGGGAPQAAAGAIVLAEGEAPDGTPWLFTTVEDAMAGSSTGIPGLVGSPCLSVPRGELVCLGGGQVVPAPSGSTALAHGLVDGPPGFPEFVVVTTTEPAASIRVLGAGPEVTAPLHPIPGTPARSAAIAFVGAPGLGLRVELLDAAGTPLPQG